jgi:hypothetical protein
MKDILEDKLEALHTHYSSLSATSKLNRQLRGQSAYKKDKISVLYID